MKLFYESIDDPKMGRLSDHDWRRCVEFFMLAGELDLDGFLPDPKDMAWRLRTTEKDILKSLESLQKTQSPKESQIITKSDDGYCVTNFKKRQKRISDAERMDAYRERKRKRDTNDTNNKQDCDEVVTSRNADIDIDKDLNKDTNIDEKNTIRAIQRMIETVTGKTPSGFKDIKAMDEMEQAGVIQEDIQAGYKWYTDQGNTFNYYGSIVKPSITAMNKRIQEKQKHKTVADATKDEPEIDYKLMRKQIEEERKARENDNANVP